MTTTTKFSIARCERFIDRVDAYDSYFTDDRIILGVLAAVTDHELTMADFIELDERPGQFGRINGRDYTASNWFRNLRITRNDPTNDLFDRLAR